MFWLEVLLTHNSQVIKMKEFETLRGCVGGGGVDKSMVFEGTCSVPKRSNWGT